MMPSMIHHNSLIINDKSLDNAVQPVANPEVVESNSTEKYSSQAGVKQSYVLTSIFISNTGQCQCSKTG